MKKLLQSLAVIATLSSSAQTLPVPSNSLVAFYDLNNTGNDLSGNNYNLNNSAITGTPDRFNATDNAMFFSGTGSTCLYMLDGTPLNVVNSNITISFWYKTNSTSYAGIIDNAQSATANGYGIDNYNGKFRFLGGGNLTGPQYKADNAWHNIVFVKSGTKGVFYQDNIATDSTNSMTALTAPTSTVQFNIGRRNNFTSYLQSANLDDIAIYNRALTRQEVSDIATYNGFVPEPPISVPVNGLFAHYPFSNSSLQDFSSFSASKLLTNSGAVSTPDRFNKASSSYSFSGVDALTLANGSALGVAGGTISISFWYKTTSTAYAGFIDNTQSATANGYGIDNNASGFRFLGGGNYSTSLFNADGQWHHVVFVKSGSFGAFYNDGVLFNWTNSMTNLTSPTAAVAFKIGARNNGAGGFIGEIDDVSIYIRALALSDVQQIYNYNNWVNISTGIAESNKLAMQLVYPNPSSGVYNIQLDNPKEKTAKIQVLSLVGEVVYESSEVDKAIDIQDLANGIYLLKIEVDGKVYSQKLIKN